MLFTPIVLNNLCKLDMLLQVGTPVVAQRPLEVQREVHAAEARGAHMAAEEAHSSSAVNSGQGSGADSFLRLMCIRVMPLPSGGFVVCVCVCDTEGDVCCTISAVSTHQHDEE